MTRMRAGTVTLGLLGAWLLAPGPANGQVDAPDQHSPASSEAGGSKTPKPRPLHIEGGSEGIVKATLTGPEFRAPQLLQGFEDYYHPRLSRLRKDYSLDQVVEAEPSEFRRLLKLRHWVHTRWPIDNNQHFSGDAFAILEKAKTGAGKLEVEIQSATPNLEAYVVSQNGGAPQIVTNGHLQWRLQAGENTLQVGSRNLFGVPGPSLTAAVVYEPGGQAQGAGPKAQENKTPPAPSTNTILPYTDQ
jgi:hypothetical protein